MDISESSHRASSSLSARLIRQEVVSTGQDNQDGPPEPKQRSAIKTNYKKKTFLRHIKLMNSVLETGTLDTFFREHKCSIVALTR